MQKADGRDLWWFTPDHEVSTYLFKLYSVFSALVSLIYIPYLLWQVFNILTYSNRAPKDFNPYNRIMIGDKVTLGVNPVEVITTFFFMVKLILFQNNF